MSLSVLHVAQPTDGGVARVVADLSRHQVRRGWNVVVACPRTGPLTSWIATTGARSLPWDATREPGRRAIGEIRSLARIIQHVHPDVAHLHSSKAGLVGRLVLRRRRCTIFQPHAWSFDAVRGPTRGATVMWERVAARWADAIVCVSTAEMERGKRLGIRGTYRVAPNGMDLDRFPYADEAERSAARHRLGLDSPSVVVCVGRLQRQKGQDILIDAWPRVLASVPDAYLVLIGAGPERRTLSGRHVPHCSFTGDRNDVADWLAAADVVAVPSRWEGFPLTLLEAMASGRSVVATDATGIREGLGKDAGAIVPIGDPGALADAIVERLRDRAKAHAEGQAGRHRVERLFDLRTTVGTVDRIYEDCLAARRR